MREIATALLLLSACAASEGGTPPDGESDGGPSLVDAATPRSDAAPLPPDASLPEPCGVCPLRFELPAAGKTSVELRGNFAIDGWENGVSLEKDGDRFVAEVELPHGRAVQYKFVVDGTSWIADPGAPFSVSDGFGGSNSARVVDCGCGETAFDWRDAVMYFVLLDRFADGDDANDAPVANVEAPANYHGGDLAGLREKLESGYFGTLGVNVIWISAPIDGAEGSGVGDDGRQYTAYHGYWPKDLEAMESRVGSLEELRQLVDAAHQRGIRVVMDYVMNHVHVSSPLYSENPSWFWPLNKDGHACVCGEQCSWDGPEGLRCWFRDYLPDFDFGNEAARKWSVGNAVEWIQKSGLDGFRLDAVKHIDMRWIDDLRGRTNAEVDFGGRLFYMVGETFTGDKALIKSYVEAGKKLDGQFDFPLRAEAARVILSRKGSMNDLAGFLAGNDGFYGPGSIMSTFLGNHDLPRAIHLAEDNPQFGEWDSGKARGWANQPQLPGERRAFERLRVGFALIFSLPGIPLIYYGDEIGMAGGGDPDNRRDMQWDGVSESQTWLRAQVARLAHVRATHAALRRGTRTPLGASGDVLVYQMADADGAVFVVLNRGDTAQATPGLPAGLYHELLADADLTAPAQIPARSAWFLVRR